MKPDTVTVEPVAVKMDTAAKMLDIGRTSLWRLVKAGKLATIRVGADQRVTTESLRRFVSDQAEAAVRDLDGRRRKR